MLRFLRQHATRWLLYMILAEFVILELALNASMRLRYFGDPAAYLSESHNLIGRGTVFALSMMLGMVALGLYKTQMRENLVGLLSRQAVGFVFGGVLLIMVYYALPQLYIGRGVLLLAIVLGLAALAVFRVIFLSVVDGDLLKRRVLVLGAGERAESIVQWMRRRSDRRSVTVVGFIPMLGDNVKISPQQQLSLDGSLYALAQSQKIDEIVVGPDDRRGSLPMAELLNCKHRGIQITELVRFLERQSGKVKLNAEPSWFIFSKGFDSSLLRKASKRAFDIITAVVVIALTWPFMLLVALAIRLESGPGKPILYSQERVGDRGKLFKLIKFRSMRTDAEQDGVARWASTGDERITRVGRLIRKLRLDELPQLWNVVKGQMSFIGPRPERPQFVAALIETISHYDLRHCVKPGLTGWAQVCYPYGASEEDAAAKLTFDLFYVKNHNLRFDLMIFIRTIEVVLFGRGSR